MNELNRNKRMGGILLNTLLAAAAVAPVLQAPVLRAQDGYNQSAYNQSGYGDPNAADPPSRVARVSVVLGNVSIEPASIQQFNVAETNYPMTTGDRIYTDAGANAEIQTGQLAVRLGQQTDLTVTAMTDTLAQFGLAQGSVHLRSYNVYQGDAVELDTPNVAVTVLQAGDVRVDVDPSNDVTTVVVLNGQVQVNGDGVEQVLEPGDRMRFQGSNPVYAEAIGGVRPDGLDRFSTQRDGLYLSAFAADGGYVNPGTIGGEDLNGYGTWQDGGDYGAAWFPAGVSYDWQPYRNGHWTWVAPWGWTWIEAEPWGFAPFHYGRWSRFGDRWGWIPGPPVVRPIYSPALVAFVGGGGFGIGLTAWFPLGPRDVYQPWYHTSPLYLNRVNVSNIYDRNVAQVRNVYNQRAVVNQYSNVHDNYANRDVATVAVSHDNFASGRPVNQAVVKLNAQQLNGAQVLPHPMVSPQRSMVASMPARALPPERARPVLASHEDTAIRPSVGMHPQGGPMQPQQRQFPAQQPPTQQQPQRFPQQQAPPQQTQQPQRSQPQPVQPQSQSTQTQQQNQQRQQPRDTMQPQVPVQVRPQNLGQPQSQPQTPAQQAPPQRPQQPAAQQPQQQPRQLFNKAVPPEPRPSFDQQRQAIQQNDPGRPLSPQQLNNLRQNQPAGPQQQKEPPHPQEATPVPAPRGGPMRPAGPPKN